MMAIEQIENTKHIFRQALFAYHLTNAALKHRNMLFKADNDPLSKFFAEHCNEFSAHMAVINTLYNFLAIPKEIIFDELNKNPLTQKILSDINNQLKKVSEIISIEKAGLDSDLFKRLRNSLAHGRFILKNGGFTFTDQAIDGKNKITFFVKAEDFAPIINDIEFKIMIPFVQDELQLSQE